MYTEIESFWGFTSKPEYAYFSQAWLCTAYRASLMLYRKLQAYTACSVRKCAARGCNNFYDLKQIVNKGGKEMFPH